MARIVHFLRLHLVGKTISSVTAVDDGIVFGKVGTSGSAVESALRGKRVRARPVLVGRGVALTGGRLSRPGAKANTFGGQAL